MLDLKSPSFTQLYEKHPFGCSELPFSKVDEHLAAIKPGELRPSASNLLMRLAARPLLKDAGL